jgi:methyl-accepting chemotaxis protein
MNLANLKIAQRLTLGFGALCAMIVAIQIAGMSVLGSMNDSAAELTQRRMPNMALTNLIYSEVNETAISLRNIMLSSDPADRQQQNDKIMKSRQSVQANLAELHKTLLHPDAVKLHERMAVANDKYVQRSDELLKRIAAGDPAEAERYLTTTLRPTLAELKDAVGDQLALQTELNKKTALEVQESFESTRTGMTVAGLVSLLLAGLIAWWNTRSITRPMARALQVANTVAAGDLTSHIEVTTKDETGQLLQALKTMNENLARTVMTVRSGTETIATASNEIAAGNLDLSSRTEQQAGSLEETASSMEELTSTVKQNAENARQANTLAEAASQVAERGGRVIGDVVGTMDRINGSAGKIADIIGVIDGIAFQTNILALNAAVEAARAGEQGRGFAVVATEVRNLAQRSAAAAKEIKGLIGDSTDAVQAGSKLVGEAGATMQEIVESVRRVTDIMSEISAASAEQTAGIEQINEAITQMDQVTQQNAALVEEAAAASASMQEQAANLTRAVSVFQVGGDAAVAAVRAAPAAPAKPRVVLAAPKAAAPRKPLKHAAPEAEWEAF